MDELRVPTVPLEAEIRYFDERPLKGRVFLPSRAQRHSGAMRPDEWMNQTTGFFPFLEEGMKRAVLLNKRYVVVLSVQQWEGTEDEVALEELGTARKVLIDCGSIRLAGVVHVNMPEAQSRLLDWANRPEPFLLLREGPTWHLIQKNRITAMTELGG